jgi:translocation and assembly module TamB
MTTNSGSGFPNAVWSRRARVLRRLFLMIAWISAGMAAAAVLAILLFIALLNVDGLHRYLLGVAQREATTAMGVPVTLENFRVNVPALRVDLYGLTVDGTAPHRTPPLLQVSHVEASIRIVSIFRLKWYLNRLDVDHPAVWIVEDEHGKSNLPVLQGDSGKSNVNLFSLAIRHAVIDSGKLYFNDRVHDINADLAQLELQAGYNSREDAYNGGLIYRNGSIQIGELQAVPHSLEASFSLKPGAFFLNRGMLTSGKSKIVIAGSVQNFSQPSVRARYDITIDGGEVRQVLHSQWAPSGIIETSGSVNYDPVPGKSFLELIAVNGTASSRALDLTTEQANVHVKDLKVDYSAAEGRLTFDRLRADLLGGEITAQGAEKVVGSHRGGNLHTRLQGISLQNAEATLLSDSPRPVSLSGRLNATTVASWGPTLNDLTAKVDATISGSLTRRAAMSGQSAQTGSMIPAHANLPISGEVHGTYFRKNGWLELSNTFFQTPATKLVVNGVAGKASSLAVRLQTSDIHELATLGSLFAKRGSARSLDSSGLAGQGSFQGRISGEITAPQIAGSLEATNVSVNGGGWRSFHANVALGPSFMRIENAYLAPETQGSIHLSASTTLNHWSFHKDNPIKARLTAARIKLTDLAQVAKQAVPVSGVVNVALDLRGNLERPEGSGKIKLTDTIAYRQPIRSATVTLSAVRGEVSGDIAIDIAGGRVMAHATVNPDQRTYEGQVSSAGIHLERLEFLKASNTPAHGILMLNVKGNGSFDNPEMEGEVKISKASVEGQAFSEIGAQVKLANRVVNASILSVVDHAQLEGHATVGLTGNYPANVTLDTGTLPLQPLLALYAPEIADETTGQTQIHLEVHGPLKDWRALTGEVTIPVLTVSYKKMASMATSGPIHIDYQGGSVHIQPVTIHGTDTNLQVQGAIPVRKNAPLSLQIKGGVNLQVAQLFNPELRSSGMAQIDIHSGSALNGGLAGQINLTGASLSYGNVPVGLSNGNGVLTLNGDRIDITEFNGSIGGGSVTAQGGVTLRPKLGFDLGMTATNVRMIYPQGMWENVEANLRLAGSTERALMGGTVGISDISFTPAFDMTSMLGQLSTSVTAPTSPGFTQNLFLNIAVHSTSVLSPASRTMSVAGTAALTIRGTAAHPALIGRVNLTGGSMIFNGDRFVLTGGTVQFVDPNEIRPVLNLALTTTIQQYDIDLRFTGPTDQLRTEFTSNPSLPRADVISLLAFGTTTEAQAANPTPANQAAESMIASGVSSQVTSRISKIAGISQLSISPVLTSGTAAGPPGAVITIRQQITGNLFITYSTNVASTQDQTFQGQYRLSPRVSVSATRDPNGGFAVDTLINKSW